MKKQCLAIFCLTSLLLSSCGDSTPSLNADDLSSLVSDSIEEEYSFDKISNLKYEEVDTNKDEMNVLTSKFSSQVPYATYLCSAELESLEMITSAQYRVTLAYDGETWGAVCCFAEDESSWAYQAKSFPNERTILSDISSFQFEDFELGYVGDETTTKVEILSNKYDESVKRETEEILLTVDLDYGSCSFGGEVIYYFINGNWTLGDFTYDDVSNWQITYDDACELDVIGDDSVKKYLTDSTNFLTYTTNEKYANACSLTQDYFSPVEDQMNVIYTFTSEYDICSCEYKVNVLYEWLSFEWGEPNVSVSISNINIDPLVGNTYAYNKNNETIEITDYHVITEDEIKSSSELIQADASSIIINGTYTINNDVYDIVACLTVPMRDNNWDAAIISSEKKLESSPDIELDSISLDLKKQTLMVDARTFVL